MSAVSTEVIVHALYPCHIRLEAPGDKLGLDFLCRALAAGIGQLSARAWCWLTDQSGWLHFEAQTPEETEENI